MPRQTDERRVVAIRLPADMVEAVDETAHALTISRNRLIQQAVHEYLQRLGDRMVAGDTPAQVAGLVL